MTIEELKKKALSLTLQPGVYLMKDKQGEIIYVGKAKALKNRVVSYFRENSSHTEKVRQMVAHVNDFDYIVTGSQAPFPQVQHPFKGRQGLPLHSHFRRALPPDHRRQAKDRPRHLFGPLYQLLYRKAERG